MKTLILLNIATILVATIRADEVATDEHRIRNLSIFSPDVARNAKATKGTKGQKATKMPKAPKVSKIPKKMKSPKQTHSPIMTTTMAPIMAPATDQNTMAPTMAPVVVYDDYTPTNREQFCEFSGFSEAECIILGDCCFYDTGSNLCLGDNESMTCPIINDDDTSDDDDEDDDGFIPTDRERYCEMQGFSEEECNNRGDCCQYDTGMNECFADNASMTCAISSDDEEDDDFDFIPTDRERYCEMQGFSEEECNNRGDCCQYDAFENECFSDNASTTCAVSSGDDDMDPPTFDDDFFMPISRELYCENQGFGEVECNVRDGCCKYDASVNECFADNESSACAMVTTPDDDNVYYNPTGTNRDLLCGGFGFGGPDEEECNNSPGDCCQYDSTENACLGNSDSMTCDVKQILCESPPDDPEMDIETNCAGLNMVLGDCCQYESTENKCLAKSDSMACVFAPTDAPTDAPTMDQIS